MKNITLLLLTAILFSCNSTSKKTADGNDEEWIQLFNGKDLSGWDLKFSGYPLNDNFNNTFRVEDGVLKVSYDNYEKFNNEYGHIFYNKKFSDYKLRVEYRFVGQQVPGGAGWAKRNNGVMIHSQSAESMGLDQDFPVSIEVQLLGGLDDQKERPTANLCTPGTNVVMDGELVTRHCTPSSSKTYYGDQWVTVDIIVHGDGDIYHVIEGDTVMHYTKPQIGGGHLPENFPLAEGTLLKEGYIALQAESHPTEFRKIELLDLSKTKK